MVILHISCWRTSLVVASWDLVLKLEGDEVVQILWHYNESRVYIIVKIVVAGFTKCDSIRRYRQSAISDSLRCPIP